MNTVASLSLPVSLLEAVGAEAVGSPKLSPAEALWGLAMYYRVAPRKMKGMIVENHQESRTGCSVVEHQVTQVLQRRHRRDVLCGTVSLLSLSKTIVLLTWSVPPRGVVGARRRDLRTRVSKRRKTKRLKTYDLMCHSRT